MKFSAGVKLHHRVNKHGKRAVYITYTYQQKTVTIETGLFVTDENWDAKKKLAIVGTADALLINASIQQAQANVLEVAASLKDPQHDIVKTRYAELSYQRAKDSMNAGFNNKLHLVQGMAKVDDYEIAKQKLADDKKSLKQRRTDLEPLKDDLAKIGVATTEDIAEVKAVRQFANLFKEYAGSGEIIPGQFNSKGKPRRDQGSIAHYTADSYKHIQSMWSILQEFSKDENYPLTIQSINLYFYKKFGNYVLFKKDNYDNYFGSLIKRIKTFMFWIESDKETPINSQVSSRKFKVLREENEVIILDDKQYELLADFRNDPECKASWIKYIDLTLFQSAMGLRHSDMKGATWRVEGYIENGEDNRVIKGSTQKNKSKYVIPVHLNKEWTLDILEKYNYDFNETARSSKHVNAKAMISEQKLNQNVKEILKVVAEKNNIFTKKIKIFKSKWGEQFLVDQLYQYEMHSSHDNRRAFITRMFRMGYTEKIVSKFVGTKSLPEMRKYIQVNDSDVTRRVTKQD